MLDVLKNYDSHVVRGKTYFFRKFSNIESNFDAYTIGYLACDGGYIVNRGFPIMSVSSTEKYIIEKFRDYWVPNNKIHDVGKKSSKKVNAINDVYELRLQSKLAKKFDYYGIFTKKLYRTIKNILPTYISPYIAGVLDSDGHIQIVERKDTLTPRLIWAVTHQSEHFLNSLKELLISVGLSPNIRKHGNRNCYRLSCTNTEINKKFLAKVLPHMLNKNKKEKLQNYLTKYSTN